MPLLVTFLTSKRGHNPWFKIYVIYVNVISLAQTIIHTIQAFYFLGATPPRTTVSVSPMKDIYQSVLTNFPTKARTNLSCINRSYNCFGSNILHLSVLANIQTTDTTCRSTFAPRISLTYIWVFFGMGVRRMDCVVPLKHNNSQGVYSTELKEAGPAAPQKVSFGKCKSAMILNLNSFNSKRKLRVGPGYVCILGMSLI